VKVKVKKRSVIGHAIFYIIRVISRGSLAKGPSLQGCNCKEVRLLASRGLTPGQADWR
jgi:hypothetical protein